MLLDAVWCPPPCGHITPWCVSRPEVRFDWTSGEKADDIGTKREQFTFNWDIIIRY